MLSVYTICIAIVKLNNYTGYMYYNVYKSIRIL